MKKLLAVVLTMILAFSCLTVLAEDEEFRKITLFPYSADMKSGVVGGFIGDLLEENYNIAVDVWAFSNERKQAIMTSRNLPDVMYVDLENFSTLIENEMVLNFDDYMDKLPMITEKDYLTNALNFTREFRSNGTGKLYGIPIRVGVNCESYSITKNMITINWPYYKGIGCPEFNDQWELLDVMEQMLKAYPVGSDGIANYGTYLNAGGDATYFSCINQYLKWFGCEIGQLPYYLITDMINGTYSSIFEEDGLYKEGLKWYNEAYRRGLLDPESINNDRQTQKARVDNGYAMVPSGSLQGVDKGGYVPIYMDGEKVYQEKWNSVYGKDYVMVISAESDNIDAALRFVNMMADPDMFLQTKVGPIGEYLVMNEDGTLDLAEKYFEDTKNGKPLTLSSGEEVTLWTYDWIIDDSNRTNFVDKDGNKRPIKPTDWPEVRLANSNTEKMNEWREKYGYDWWVDQVKAQGNYYNTSILDDVGNFASIPDDFMKLTQNAIKEKVVTASWQMVYAESEDEFEAIWEQMVNEAMELGAQDIIDWRLNDLENALNTKLSLAD